MYALIALRGDTGPAGNVVTGGAFCFVGQLEWKTAPPAPPAGDQGHSRTAKLAVLVCLRANFLALHL